MCAPRRPGPAHRNVILITSIVNLSFVNLGFGFRFSFRFRLRLSFCLYVKIQWNFKCLHNIISNSFQNTFQDPSYLINAKSLQNNQTRVLMDKPSKIVLMECLSPKFFPTHFCLIRIYLALQILFFARVRERFELVFVIGLQLIQGQLCQRASLDAACLYRKAEGRPHTFAPLSEYHQKPNQENV